MRRTLTVGIAISFLWALNVQAGEGAEVYPWCNAPDRMMGCGATPTPWCVVYEEQVNDTRVYNATPSFGIPCSDVVFDAECAQADLSGDGVVGGPDFLIVSDCWGVHWR